MLGKDLRPGHLTTFGLVLKVDHKPDGIWEGPHVTFMENNNPYYGVVVCPLELEREYELLFQQGTPQYREKVKYMITCCTKTIDDAQNNIKELLQYVK